MGKLNLIKFKIFWASEFTMKKVGRPPTEQEENISNHTFGKRLVSRAYTEHHQFHPKIKRQNNPVQKDQRENPSRYSDP